MNIIDALPLIDKITEQLTERLASRHITDYHIVGIQKGGVTVAGHIASQLSIEQKLGSLDISFYRDDFRQSGLKSSIKPSHIPFDVTDQNIVLVDDVVQTGRTIHAALDTLFEYGRPASVLLVCLVELEGKELPICPDVVGVRIDRSQGKRVKLMESESLQLQVFSE